MSKGTYSFTTPIYYVNAAPHLGTAYTTVAADTVARYQRMNGYDVAFVTGMDEHGQKVAETAEKNGMTPQAWCDSMEPVFREAWDLLDITYTDFVRTSEPRQASHGPEVLAGPLRPRLAVQGCLRGLVLASTKRRTTLNPTWRRTRTANSSALTASVRSAVLPAKRTGSLSFPNSRSRCSSSTRSIRTSFVLRRAATRWSPS